MYSQRAPAPVSVLPWLRDAAAGRDPFLAWVHFFDPPSPQQPPPHILQRVRSSPYDGEISFVDEQIAYPFVGEVGRAAFRQTYRRRDELFPYATGTDSVGFSHLLLPFLDERV